MKIEPQQMQEEVTMIFAKLNATNAKNAYPEAIQRALDFLKSTDLMKLEPGKYPIDGEHMFANVMDMTTHGFEGSHPEVHKKYVDLMYWPEGGEKIGVSPYLGTEEVYEAHPENDISLLENVQNESILVATEGCFGVFFPWDAHRPAMMLGDSPATSRKCVIKIAMELFE
jgi:biofilm protein TabA